MKMRPQQVANNPGRPPPPPPLRQQQFRAQTGPPAPCSPVLPCSFSGVCCKKGSKSLCSRRNKSALPRTQLNSQDPHRHASPTPTTVEQWNCQGRAKCQGRTSPRASSLLLRFATRSFISDTSPTPLGASSRPVALGPRHVSLVLGASMQRCVQQAASDAAQYSVHQLRSDGEL